MHRLGALLLVVACAACRDATEPFQPTDRPPIDDDPIRLTLGPTDDRSPSWSPGSDTVYYSASEWDDVPVSDGVLLAVPVRGGAARPLLLSQIGRAAAPRLLEPGTTPGHDAIAFIEKRGIVQTAPCAHTQVTCSLDALPSPALTENWLGVAASADTPGDWAEVARLTFDGAPVSVGVMAQVVLYESRYHPYQHAWLVRRALPFKPTWSPDAARIATVDHEGLRIVDVTTGDMTTIVGGDVANPDWSPDGEWIAFDRVERLDSVSDLCLYQIPSKDGLVPACWERRVFYTTTAPELFLVRPDGSEPQSLGAGADPAWSPDGTRLYHVADGRIVARDMATGVTTPVADTEGGEEPAVSPDGGALAFTRYDPEVGTRDVWVVSLGDD